MNFFATVPTAEAAWPNYAIQVQEALELDTLALSSPARISYASLLRYVFLSEDASFSLLDDQLTQMRSLIEGWDSYGAPVPSPGSIDKAREAIQKLRFGQLLPETVAPSAEGGVSIYFSVGHRKAFIEFMNEGEVLFARYDKDDVPEVKILQNGPQYLNDTVLQEIRDHLRARA